MSTPRAENLRRHQDRAWTREQWSGRGRPVHLINDPSFDRSAWWPVAAGLAADCAVAVFDPPGHGDAGDLADDLASFTAGSGTRAPIVVGHESAALVAAVFAARYLAHAVVAVEHYLDTAESPCPELRAIVDGSRSFGCPYLSVFALAPRDGYTDWLRRRAPAARCEVYETPAPFPHLRRAERFTDDLRALAS
ncbi:alpha/beta fold hydrolase [Glycomyces sp. NRRL B-16210]|uniref:alpha/beta fold hydrolase n=1 Tax=Glycomyces sp. NRRL B-16210 TaxID=1463821 RepID=UPI0004BF95DA|nr:alpha/beta fold hydrolase [Glycomyces sp. NRRL B-16210]